jgi:hypothetical protein
LKDFDVETPGLLKRTENSRQDTARTDVVITRNRTSVANIIRHESTALHAGKEVVPQGQRTRPPVRFAAHGRRPRLSAVACADVAEK